MKRLVLALAWIVGVGTGLSVDALSGGRPPAQSGDDPAFCSQRDSAGAKPDLSSLAAQLNQRRFEGGIGLPQRALSDPEFWKMLKPEISGGLRRDLLSQCLIAPDSDASSALRVQASQLLNKVVVDATASSAEKAAQCAGFRQSAKASLDALNSLSGRIQSEIKANFDRKHPSKPNPAAPPSPRMQTSPNMLRNSVS